MTANRSRPSISVASGPCFLPSYHQRTPVPKSEVILLAEMNHDSIVVTVKPCSPSFVVSASSSDLVTLPRPCKS